MSAAEVRRNRLNQELEALSQLARTSSIFFMEHEEDLPPDVYTFIFRGMSLSNEGHEASTVVPCREQRCEIRLPIDYPHSPPDIHWLTPIWHPNVPTNGYVEPEDIGLPWTPAADMTILAASLWDVSRMAFVNASRVQQDTAWQWWQTQATYHLPVDARELRGRDLAVNRNVVKYSQKGPLADNLSVAEIQFLDEPRPATTANQSEVSGTGDRPDIIFLDE